MLSTEQVGENTSLVDAASWQRVFGIRQNSGWLFPLLIFLEDVEKTI